MSFVIFWSCVEIIQKPQKMPETQNLVWISIFIWKSISSTLETWIYIAFYKGYTLSEWFIFSPINPKYDILLNVCRVRIFFKIWGSSQDTRKMVCITGFSFVWRIKKGKDRKLLCTNNFPREDLKCRFWTKTGTAQHVVERYFLMSYFEWYDGNMNQSDKV